ncbi:hypothetical protein EVAR_41349_1 [Eumeta japonica]|uniref:Uncharacterized protein n=1 Tax=Eumeta variegata TaxID=151549 RepID=A0A4C1XQT1_EUMVA|nr:hypothetical protein EVAR_41349_1 [Eumeta japonica]
MRNVRTKTESCVGTCERGRRRPAGCQRVEGAGSPGRDLAALGVRAESTMIGQELQGFFLSYQPQRTKLRKTVREEYDSNNYRFFRLKNLNLKFSKLTQWVLLNIKLKKSKRIIKAAIFRSPDTETRIFPFAVRAKRGNAERFSATQPRPRDTVIAFAHLQMHDSSDSMRCCEIVTIPALPL